MVISLAHNAGTAPCLTIEEQIVGSTSANRVKLRAPSSMSCELCSALSRPICSKQHFQLADTVIASLISAHRFTETVTSIPAVNLLPISKLWCNGMTDAYTRHCIGSMTIGGHLDRSARHKIKVNVSLSIRSRIPAAEPAAPEAALSVPLH